MGSNVSYPNDSNGNGIPDYLEVNNHTVSEDNLEVYSSLTPNGDGNNDILFVRGLWVEKVIFRVFDRWGELVFESHDINAYWDGNYGQNKALEGHYSYFLTYMEVSTKEVKTLVGSLSLLK